MKRQHLPNRRAHELLDFEHGGIRYTAGIGRFDNGNLAEIFLNAGKAGSGLETNARDAAVILSIALQHGTPLEIVRHALMRDGRGRASGPIGEVLDLIAADGGAS